MGGGNTKPVIPAFTGASSDVEIRAFLKNHLPEKNKWSRLNAFETRVSERTNQVNGEFTKKVDYSDLKVLRDRVLTIWPNNARVSLGRLGDILINKNNSLEGVVEQLALTELETAGMCVGNIIQGKEMLDRLTNPVRVPPPKIITLETVRVWLEKVASLKNYAALKQGLDRGYQNGRRLTEAEAKKNGIKGTSAEIKKKLENVVNLTGLSMLNALNEKFIARKTTGYSGVDTDVEKIGYMIGSMEVILNYALSHNVEELTKDDLDVIPHVDTHEKLVADKKKTENGGGTGIPIPTPVQPSFLEKYKWWLIGGGVATIVVAGVGIGIATA